MKVFDYENYNWRKGISLQVDAGTIEIIAKNLKEEIKKAADADDYNTITALIESLKVINEATDELKKKEKEKAQEDADPENDWVYVSTGVMPTHDNDVLVTCEYEGDRYVGIDSHHEDGWINNDSVVAWRELPEPAEPAEDADA